MQQARRWTLGAAQRSLALGELLRRKPGTVLVLDGGTNDPESIRTLAGLASVLADQPFTVILSGATVSEGLDAHEVRLGPLPVGSLSRLAAGMGEVRPGRLAQLEVDHRDRPADLVRWLRTQPNASVAAGASLSPARARALFRGWLDAAPLPFDRWASIPASEGLEPRSLLAWGLETGRVVRYDAELRGVAAATIDELEPLLDEDEKAQLAREGMGDGVDARRALYGSLPERLATTEVLAAAGRADEILWYARSPDRTWCCTTGSWQGGARGGRRWFRNTRTRWRKRTSLH